MPFIELQSIDSTNNYARSLISEGLAQDGTAVFAHEQWAGKGQRGNKWLSEKGSNIILSILAKPGNLGISQQFDISLCTAVTLFHFFNHYTNGDCSIKWPNDLYWQDRKAGGILIENVIRGTGATASWDWVIIGIGVNINQAEFPPEIKKAVSLKQITGRNWDPVLLAKELADIWQKNFNVLQTSGPVYFFEDYQKHLYKIGQSARFKKDNRIFEAVISGISPGGRLILNHSSTESFAVGEVELLQV